MKYLLNTVTLSMVLLMAVSCSDDDNSVNDQGQVAFTMKGSNSDAGANSGRVMNDLQITSATAAITEVELESDNENDSTESENEAEFEGQFMVDLLAGTSDPAFGTSEVTAQTYNELSIEFGTFLENNASLIIEGIYTNDNGEEVPFKYTLDKDLEIEIESNNSFIVSAGSLKEITAEIDFATLFSDIDFDLADTNADGIVIVNASLNTYVYNLISQNFNAAIELEVEID
ncbi:MAG: DUF4382 domain-containing protein [Fulvivirga sp.]